MKELVDGRILMSIRHGGHRWYNISEDGGETWPVSRVVVPYSSAYSSLCVLPDGTIGLYVEEEPAGTSGYSMVFYNFNLEWLTDKL